MTNSLQLECESNLWQTFPGHQVLSKYAKAIRLIEEIIFTEQTISPKEFDTEKLQPLVKAVKSKHNASVKDDASKHIAIKNLFQSNCCSKTEDLIKNHPKGGYECKWAWRYIIDTEIATVNSTRCINAGVIVELCEPRSEKVKWWYELAITHAETDQQTYKAAINLCSYLMIERQMVSCAGIVSKHFENLKYNKKHFENLKYKTEHLDLYEDQFASVLQSLVEPESRWMLRHIKTELQGKTSMFALSFLGILEYKARRYRQAFRYLEQCLEMVDSPPVILLVYKNRILFEQGQFQDALDGFNKCNAVLDEFKPESNYEIQTELLNGLKDTVTWGIRNCKLYFGEFQRDQDIAFEIPLNLNIENSRAIYDYFHEVAPGRLNDFVLSSSKLLPPCLLEHLAEKLGLLNDEPNVDYDEAKKMRIQLLDSALEQYHLIFDPNCDFFKKKSNEISELISGLKFDIDSKNDSLQHQDISFDTFNENFGEETFGETTDVTALLNQVNLLEQSAFQHSYRIAEVEHGFALRKRYFDDIKPRLTDLEHSQADLMIKLESLEASHESNKEAINEVKDELCFIKHVLGNINELRQAEYLLQAVCKDHEKTDALQLVQFADYLSNRFRCLTHGILAIASGRVAAAKTNRDHVLGLGFALVSDITAIIFDVLNIAEMGAGLLLPIGINFLSKGVETIVEIHNQNADISANQKLSQALESGSFQTEINHKIRSIYTAVWLQHLILRGDPRKQKANWKIMADFILNNYLDEIKSEAKVQKLQQPKNNYLLRLSKSVKDHANVVFNTCSKLVEDVANKLTFDLLTTKIKTKDRKEIKFEKYLHKARVAYYNDCNECNTGPAYKQWMITHVSREDLADHGKYGFLCFYSGEHAEKAASEMYYGKKYGRLDWIINTMSHQDNTMPLPPHPCFDNANEQQQRANDSLCHIHKKG